MATRAIIRFATREEGVTFSAFPLKHHAQLYKHHDGDPESLGLDIANSIEDGVSLDNIEIDALDLQRGDINYIYYIWQCEEKSTWISIFKADYNYCPSCGQRDDECGEPPYECIFVGEPRTLQDKFRDGKIV